MFQFYHIMLIGEDELFQFFFFVSQLFYKYGQYVHLIFSQLNFNILRKINIIYKIQRICQIMYILHISVYELPNKK